jgi:hypothetical protein
MRHGKTAATIELLKARLAAVEKERDEARSIDHAWGLLAADLEQAVITIEKQAEQLRLAKEALEKFVEDENWQRNTGKRLNFPTEAYRLGEDILAALNGQGAPREHLLAAHRRLVEAQLARQALHRLALVLPAIDLQIQRKQAAPAERLYTETQVREAMEKVKAAAVQRVVDEIQKHRNAERLLPINMAVALDLDAILAAITKEIK